MDARCGDTAVVEQADQFTEEEAAERRRLPFTGNAGPPGAEVAHSATLRELAAQGLPLDREDLDELK